MQALTESVREGKQVKRVLIVGCPGAGKSTVAKQLAEITGLPLIHLDQHYWLPSWKRPSSAAWRQKIEELASEPAWIMDGNYSGTLEQRLAFADTLVHLDYPTWLCVWRVIRRTLSGLGGNRNDELAPGCAERLDWSFLGFVIDYRKVYRERDFTRMEGFPGQLFRFTSPSELSAFITEFQRDATRVADPPAPSRHQLGSRISGQV